MKRLSKSGIEYLDYAWNFYSGCENSERGICPMGKDCWARKITERFKNRYPNGFEPTFYPEAFLSPLHLKKPARIGVCFMGDLFGDWINYADKNGTVTPKNIVYPIVERCPQHTFLFLTKCPQNLIKFSPFPPNCWIGMTVTKDGIGDSSAGAIPCFEDIEAKVKFISFEPLLEPVSFHYYSGFVNWVIIGTLTGTKQDLLKLKSQCPQLILMPYGKKWTLQPQISWVEEIVRAADRAGIPVFLKNNLKPLILSHIRDKDARWADVLLDAGGNLRQEMANG